MSFVQKKVGRLNCLEFEECDTCMIDRRSMEKAFIVHFDDRSIQLSNMKIKKTKKCKRRPGCYDVEVFTKGEGFEI